MTKRLQRIFSEIPPCASFADVGCDHGYIAEQMIVSGKCSKVTVSDISLPSLKKAQKLLKKYIDQNIVTAICTDGLLGVDQNTQVVLIAGMGGEEIIKILSTSAFLPPVLVLQPMKNVDKVRKFLFEIGYGITKDYLFFDKKYYNLIVCKFGEKVLPYTQEEIILGRTNLLEKSEDFVTYLKNEILATEEYLSKALLQSEKETLTQKLELYKRVLYGN